MKVKIKGFRELERALAEELPKATARNVLRRTATNSMERIRTKMAELAPYDPNDRDGNGQHLNETMKTQTPKAGEARKMGVTSRTGVIVLTGPAPVGQRMRSNAGWQENGTVKMPPNPFARPAADTEADNVIDQVREELAEQIELAKGRIARKALRVKR